MTSSLQCEEGQGGRGQENNLMSRTSDPKLAAEVRNILILCYTEVGIYKKKY